MCQEIILTLANITGTGHLSNKSSSAYNIMYSHCTIVTCCFCSVVVSFGMNPVGNFIKEISGKEIFMVKVNCCGLQIVSIARSTLETFIMD